VSEARERIDREATALGDCALELRANSEVE
jgi:hypothetical protein